MSTYMDYTQIQEAPEEFHFACGLTCLSLASHGARYLEFEHYKVFPNLYTLLLAKTAECRKGGATEIAQGIIEEAGLAGIDSMSEKITEAGLWLQGEENVDIYGNSTVFVFADELSVALSKHEAYSGLVPFLTRFYAARRGVYTKRTASKGPVTLTNPYIVTLLGTTPTDFAALIPASASGTGFAPRLWIIYQDTPKGKIAYPKAPAILRNNLIADLKTIAASCNPNEPKAYRLSPEARIWYKEWYEKRNPRPEDPELDGWHGRKHTNLLKVTLLLAMSESDDLILETPHLEMSLEIVNRIEINLVKAYRLLGQIPMAVHGGRIVDQLARRERWLSRSELQHLNGGRMRAQELTEVLYNLEVEGRIGKEVKGTGTYYGLKGTKRE
jgi:hypothetical protein